MAKIFPRDKEFKNFVEKKRDELTIQMNQFLSGKLHVGLQTLKEAYKFILNGPSMIVGGTLRNIVLERHPSKDVDIVCMELNHDLIKWTEEEPSYIRNTHPVREIKRNYMGGLRLNINGTEFDIWELKNMNVFKNYMEDEDDFFDGDLEQIDGIKSLGVLDFNNPTILDYVKVIGYNLEAIGFIIDFAGQDFEDNIVENGFFAGIHDRMVRFVNPFSDSDYQLKFRAKKFSALPGFSLSKRIKKKFDL